MPRTATPPSHGPFKPRSFPPGSRGLRAGLMPAAILLAVLLATTVAAGAANAVSLTGGRTAAAPVVKVGKVAAREKILVDAGGRTLYAFTRDRNGHSACSPACAKDWTPLPAPVKARALGGAKAKLLGRVRRSDGSFQLTYGHHPLYLFKLDKRAGQVNGQDRKAFGGRFYALSLSGRLIRTATLVPSVEISTRKLPGLGEVLVDGKGLTLYLFVPDKRRHVTCVQGCAVAWPPVMLPNGARAVAAGAAKPTLLGSDADPAGGRVVTYDGWPLYTWVGDRKPGQATGQALNVNGGLWYVLAPSGKVIRNSLASSETAAAQRPSSTTPSAAPSPVMSTTTANTTTTTTAASGADACPGGVTIQQADQNANSPGDRDQDDSGGPSDGDGCL